MDRHHLVGGSLPPRLPAGGDRIGSLFLEVERCTLNASGGGINNGDAAVIQIQFWGEEEDSAISLVPPSGVATATAAAAGDGRICSSSAIVEYPLVGTVNGVRRYLQDMGHLDLLLLVKKRSDDGPAAAATVGIAPLPLALPSVTAVEWTMSVVEGASTYSTRAVVPIVSRQGDGSVLQLGQMQVNVTYVLNHSGAADDNLKMVRGMSQKRQVPVRIPHSLAGDDCTDEATGAGFASETAVFEGPSFAREVEEMRSTGDEDEHATTRPPAISRQQILQPSSPRLLGNRPIGKEFMKPLLEDGHDRDAEAPSMGHQDLDVNVNAASTTAAKDDQPNNYEMRSFGDNESATTRLDSHISRQQLLQPSPHLLGVDNSAGKGFVELLRNNDGHDHDAEALSMGYKGMDDGNTTSTVDEANQPNVCDDNRAEPELGPVGNDPQLRVVEKERRDDQARKVTTCTTLTELLCAGDQLRNAIDATLISDDRNLLRDASGAGVDVEEDGPRPFPHDDDVDDEHPVLAVERCDVGGLTSDVMYQGIHDDDDESTEAAVDAMLSSASGPVPPPTSSVAFPSLAAVDRARGERISRVQFARLSIENLNLVRLPSSPPPGTEVRELFVTYTRPPLVVTANEDDGTTPSLLESGLGDVVVSVLRPTSKMNAKKMMPKAKRVKRPHDRVIADKEGITGGEYPLSHKELMGISFRDDDGVCSWLESHIVFTFGVVRVETLPRNKGGRILRRASRPGRPRGPMMKRKAKTKSISEPEQERGGQEKTSRQLIAKARLPLRNVLMSPSLDVRTVLELEQIADSQEDVSEKGRIERDAVKQSKSIIGSLAVRLTLVSCGSREQCKRPSVPDVSTGICSEVPPNTSKPTVTAIRSPNKSDIDQEPVVEDKQPLPRIEFSGVEPEHIMHAAQVAQVPPTSSVPRAGLVSMLPSPLWMHVGCGSLSGLKIRGAWKAFVARKAHGGGGSSFHYSDNFVPIHVRVRASCGAALAREEPFHRGQSFAAAGPAFSEKRINAKKAGGTSEPFSCKAVGLSWQPALQIDPRLKAPPSQQIRNVSVVFEAWMTVESFQEQPSRFHEWNRERVASDVLVGLAKVPLSSLSTSLERPGSSGSSVPSIAANDWVELRNPYNGSEMGKLFVTVAVGLLRQMKNFQAALLAAQMIQRHWRYLADKRLQDGVVTVCSKGRLLDSIPSHPTDPCKLPAKRELKVRSKTNPRTTGNSPAVTTESQDCRLVKSEASTGAATIQRTWRRKFIGNDRRTQIQQSRPETSRHKSDTTADIQTRGAAVEKEAQQSRSDTSSRHESDTTADVHKRGSAEEKELTLRSRDAVLSRLTGLPLTGSADSDETSGLIKYVVELRPEGVCCESSSITDFSPRSPWGCNLGYSLPMHLFGSSNVHSPDQAEASPAFSAQYADKAVKFGSDTGINRYLWWDASSSILNGAARHILHLPPNINVAEALCPPRNDNEVLSIGNAQSERGMIFQLCFPQTGFSKGEVVIARATIPYSDLKSMYPPNSSSSRGKVVTSQRSIRVPLTKIVQQENYDWLPSCLCLNVCLTADTRRAANVRPGRDKSLGVLSHNIKSVGEVTSSRIEASPPDGTILEETGKVKLGRKNVSESSQAAGNKGEKRLIFHSDRRGGPSWKSPLTDDMLCSPSSSSVISMPIGLQSRESNMCTPQPMIVEETPSFNDAFSNHVPSTAADSTIIIHVRNAGGLKEVMALWSSLNDEETISSAGPSVDRAVAGGFCVSFRFYCGQWPITRDACSEVGKWQWFTSKVICFDNNLGGASFDFQAEIPVKVSTSFTEHLNCNSIDLQLWYVSVSTTDMTTPTHSVGSEEQSVPEESFHVCSAQLPLHPLLLSSGGYEGKFAWEISLSDIEGDAEDVGFVYASVHLESEGRCTPAQFTQTLGCLEESRLAPEKGRSYASPSLTKTIKERGECDEKPVVSQESRVKSQGDAKGKEEAPPEELDSNQEHCVDLHQFKNPSVSVHRASAILSEERQDTEGCEAESVLNGSTTKSLHEGLGVKEECPAALPPNITESEQSSSLAASAEKPAQDTIGDSKHSVDRLVADRSVEEVVVEKVLSRLVKMCSKDSLNNDRPKDSASHTQEEVSGVLCSSSSTQTESVNDENDAKEMEGHSQPQVLTATGNTVGNLPDQSLGERAEKHAQANEVSAISSSTQTEGNLERRISGNDAEEDEAELASYMPGEVRGVPCSSSSTQTESTSDENDAKETEGYFQPQLLIATGNTACNMSNQSLCEHAEKYAQANEGLGDHAEKHAQANEASAISSCTQTEGALETRIAENDAKEEEVQSRAQRLRAPEYSVAGQSVQNRGEGAFNNGTMQTTVTEERENAFDPTEGKEGGMGVRFEGGHTVAAGLPRKDMLFSLHKIVDMDVADHDRLALKSCSSDEQTPQCASLSVQFHENESREIVVHNRERQRIISNQFVSGDKGNDSLEDTSELILHSSKSDYIDGSEFLAENSSVLMDRKTSSRKEILCGGDCSETSRLIKSLDTPSRIDEEHDGTEALAVNVALEVSSFPSSDNLGLGAVAKFPTFASEKLLETEQTEQPKDSRLRRPNEEHKTSIMMEDGDNQSEHAMDINDSGYYQEGQSVLFVTNNVTDEERLVCSMGSATPKLGRSVSMTGDRTITESPSKKESKSMTVPRHHVMSREESELKQSDSPEQRDPTDSPWNGFFKQINSTSLETDTGRKGPRAVVGDMVDPLFHSGKGNARASHPSMHGLSRNRSREDAKEDKTVQEHQPKLVVRQDVDANSLHSDYSNCVAASWSRSRWRSFASSSIQMASPGDSCSDTTEHEISLSPARGHHLARSATGFMIDDRDRIAHIMDDRLRPRRTYERVRQYSYHSSSDDDWE